MSEVWNWTAFDTETELFETGYKAPLVVCLSWATPMGSGLYLRKDAERWIRDQIKIARNGGPKLIGHNVAYDVACLMSSVPECAQLLWEAYDEGLVHCTQVRAKLIDTARGHLRLAYDEHGDVKRANYGLADLTKRLLNEELQKEGTPRLEYARLKDVPLEQWTSEEIQYPIRDADVTRRIAEAQTAEAMQMGYAAFEAESARQARAALALYLSTAWGLTIDHDRVRELSVGLNERLETSRTVLTKAGIFSAKGSKSMLKIKELICAAHPNPPRTEKGAIKTGAEVLEECALASAADEVARLKHPLHVLVAFNRAQKMLSTYVDRLALVSMVHPEYDFADTGRTTCRGPNIQNQPRALEGFKFGVRECFKARDGHVLVSVDYDSQELRTLAQVLETIVGSSKLAERYRQDPGYDPHIDFAARLLGLTYQDALARKKEPEIKAMRQRAKAANFGFPGGMGAFKFRLYARGYGVNLSDSESEALRDAWFAQWPEMLEYHTHVKIISQNGTGNLVHLFSGRVRGQIGFSDGANSYFQGLASDASKTAMYEVSRRCYADPESPLYGCRIVAFVHDEIIMEASKELAHEAATELTKVMIEAMEAWTPDVPAKASPALMYHWSKDAEEARDSNGKLIPWEDRRTA